MNDLFAYAAHNTVLALVLALFVYGLTRVWRNPPVAHVLWLLVLLRLVVPPVFQLDRPALRLSSSMYADGGLLADPSPTADPKADGRTGLAERSTSEANARGLIATSTKQPEVTVSIEQRWKSLRPALLWLWIAGAVLTGLIAAIRILRFERLLRDTLPASKSVQRLTREIADDLGVRRVPDVHYVQSVDVPLVWCPGRRPRIVLPMRLIHQLDDQQIGMILAHELAHLRRRDHWVRIVELIVATVYWWNPLVWVIRRQLHHVEDLCCDGWVRDWMPDCKRRYAEVLLQTAESLGDSQFSTQLLPASPFFRPLSLRARIEMIFESRFAPQLSKRSMLVATLVGLLLLPSFMQTTSVLASDEPQAVSDGQTDATTTAAFPNKVQFEQGATNFKEGDDISILEIRGTEKTFVPGNIYWIKGTYTLASRDRAMLAAFTTARHFADGKSRTWKVQTTMVDRGKGTFTLFLPMHCEGWPHVSFYGAVDGQGFGGNYFGTGDSVLKKWWGER